MSQTQQQHQQQQQVMKKDADPAEQMGQLNLGGRPQRNRQDSGVYDKSSSAASTTSSSAGNVSAPKTKAGTLGTATTISSLTFAITSQQHAPIFRYQVEIEEVQKEGKTKQLGRGGSNDYFLSLRQELAYYIYACLAEQREAAFFKNIKETTYDRSHILFTSNKLKCGNGQENKVTFKVSMKELEQYLRTIYPQVNENLLRTKYDLRPHVTGFDVHVWAAEGKDGLAEFSLTDLRPLVGADEDGMRDRSVMQFLEQLTSQELIYNMSHRVLGNSVYQMQGSKINDWAEVADGYKKNVKLIEGVKGPMLVLQLDYKVTAFLINQSVVQFLAAKYRVNPNSGDFFGAVSGRALNEASKFLRDVAIEFNRPKAPTLQRFMAAGLSPESASMIRFKQEDGSEITVADYFKKAGSPLKLPHWPCVVVNKGPKGKSYYPIEFCMILPSQRLDRAKAEVLAADLIKKSAILPDMRQKRVMDMATSASANVLSNEFLAKAGVKISAQPMTLDARVLPRPSVIYDKNDTANTDEHGGWKRQRRWFIRGARMDKFAVCLLKDMRGQPPVQQAQWNQFKQEYLDTCRKCGMKNVAEPVTTLVQDDKPENIESMLKNALSNKVPFVLFVAPDQSTTHGSMKMHEQQTGILTQQINAGTLLRAIGQDGRTGRPDWNTTENIVAKTNMKLGGMNYDLDDSQLRITNRQEWLAHNRMFIGLDASHAPPLPKSLQRKGVEEKQPSTIGFCSNAGTHPLHFVGEYSFQAPRQEIADAAQIKAHVSQALKQFAFNNKKYPSEIWVYRDGVDEGKFKQVQRYEVDQIRQAVAELITNAQQRPKLVYIIVTKRHNTRLLPAAEAIKAAYAQAGGGRVRAPDANIKCGTVTDTVIVSATRKEFLLNSHKTIQGSACTPKYTVLVDDMNYDMDVLETVTHKLCFAHGIITAAISKPAPVYAAKNLAKRGVANLKAYLQEKRDSSGVSVSSGIDSEMGDSMYDVSIEELNAKLKIDTRLVQKTYWA